MLPDHAPVARNKHNSPIKYHQISTPNSTELLTNNEKLRSSLQKQSKVGKKIRLNISGNLFETYMKTLQSREGSIFRLMEVYDFYDTENQEFYFDRNSKAFEGIFVYLQTGILKQPEHVPFKIFIEDLQYFGFHEKALQIYTAMSNREVIDSRNEKEEDDLTLREYIWSIFEKPDFNVSAKLIAMGTSFTIFLSIVLFCVETLPTWKQDQLKILSYIEMFCVSWFTIELALRFICSYGKLSFFLNFMNIVDLVSILPFYIGLLINTNQSFSLSALRVLRMVRLFRIFKLYRYSKAIHLIIHTIRSSLRELLLLGVFILLLVVLFSAAIYYFESSDAMSQQIFLSIPHTFWLCIVTLTTVGYGDMTPVTLGGKLVCGLLTITGLIVIALPIPIVVSNFTRHYDFIMSENPAFIFDFDIKKSFHLTSSKDLEGKDRETRL